MIATPPPALYLLPSPLWENSLWGLPADTLQTLLGLRHLVVETPKPARRYLAAAAKAQGMTTELIADYTLYELRPDTPDQQLMDWLLHTVRAGLPLGLVSDAGAPAVADPGSRLVAWAHEMRLPVRPMAGPSSILLALMASGMQGQSFAFHGYLPIAEAARKKELRRLEEQSRQHNQTQIFIETPYRNQHLLHSCMAALQQHTRLAVVAGLAGPQPFIFMGTLARWQQLPVPDLNKQPAIFLIYAGIV